MSGKPFDDSARARLAKSILSGKEPDGDESNSTTANAEHELEGEWDGDLRVDKAADGKGLMISHTRHVPAPKSPKSPKAAGAPTDIADGAETIAKKHNRMFQTGDKAGIAAHLHSIIASPMRQRGW